MAYGFYLDSSICSGCKSCQVACKETNHLGVKNLWRRVYNYQGGSWELNEAGSYVPQGVFGYFVSMACNHCTDAACVASCPTGAMQKDPETGIVWTDHEVCIGCGTCVAACPYKAPQLDEAAGYAIKCDMCKAEVDAGEKPLCVTACPMRALDWGEYDELVAKYGEGNIEIEPLPVNTTGATTIIKAHPAAQPSGQGTGTLVSFAEEL